MAREFSVSAANDTVGGTGPITLTFINPAAAPNFNIEILRKWISFSGNATSAQQKVLVFTKVTAFPTLTSATPAKLKRADPNVSIITGGTAGAAGTAGTNASAQGAGTETTVFADAFNHLNGWLYCPTPAETIVMPASSTSGIGMLLSATIGTLTGWSYGTNFREV